MSEKRRGLGRGIGALIPPAPSSGTSVGRVPGRDRPVDVFFPNGPGGRHGSVSRGTEDTPDDVAPEGDESPDTTGTSAAEGRGSGGTSVPRETTSPAATSQEEASTAEPSPGIGDARSSGSDGRDASPGGQEQDEAPTPADVRDDDTDGLVPVPGARFAELPVASIRPNSRQPRQVFEQDAMDELVHSVREIGILQPVVVRPLAEPDADGARYELIMGERRWRASTEAGLAVVPAIVRATDDDVMLRDALLENLHRSELNPLEEAAAYQQLLEDFGCTQDELSRRIGRSRPQISNTIRLLRLPPAVQRRVAAGVLSAGHARALLGLDDGVAAERLAHRIVSEGLSVRAVEEIVSSRTGTTPRTSAPRAGRHLPLLDDVASRLSDRLDTRVKVALGRNRGRVTVEFATVEDLDRILSVLDPGGPGVTGSRPDEFAPTAGDLQPSRQDDNGTDGADTDGVAVERMEDPVVAVGEPEERYGY